MKLLSGRLHITALLLASSVALTACGGGGGSSSGNAAPPSTPSTQGGNTQSGTAPSPNSSSVLPSMPQGPTTAPAKVISAFARCLRQHGFNVPDDLQKWTPPPGTDTSKAQTAVAACFQFMTAHPTP